MAHAYSTKSQNLEDQALSMFENLGKLPNTHFELWLWNLQRMSLGVEYPIIQADQVRR